MEKLNTVRTFLIVAFIVFLFVGVGYKYFEWNTLNTLSQLYNSSWNKEFNLIEAENKNSKDFGTLLEKVLTSKTYPDDLKTNYDELIGKLRLVIASQEEYNNAIKSNKQQFDQLNTALLFGRRGELAKKLIKDQSNYYSFEINNADYSDASNWLGYNMLSAWKDQVIADKFSNTIIKDPLNSIPKYFPNISALEKYTSNNFKFDHEDLIKQYLPNGYEALNRYKAYFSGYYSVTKDVVNGDYESTRYKLAKLSETRTNLNINFFDLFSEGNSKRIENAKNIILLVSDGAALIKDFKNKGLYRYPLLKSVNNWDEDLVLCQMYNYKSSVYHNMTTKYVSAKTVTDLLNELSTAPPNTTTIDSQFDKKTMSFTNDDKAVTFKCTGKLNKTYTFETTK